MTRILKNNNKRTLLYYLVLCFSSLNLFVQSDTKQATRALVQRDSLFWVAYNTCDTTNIEGFYTTDVEFYHDKIGLSKGNQNIVSSFKKNLCTDNFRLRRAALDSTIQIFLLRNQDTIYGAIMSGEHYFYITEKGKKERLDGWAKFTHTWTLQNGVWKMARLLSYDHKPAPYINKRTFTKISTTILDAYAGEYKSSAVSNMTIKRENQYLIQIINGKKFAIYPETSTLFFSKERDLTFEFLTQKNKSRKIVVRENGEIVDEMVSSK
ncbi:hypothetical protein [Ferruginibacter sp. SUN106]|uniref:hypothetical protein n=1 Tax=Ferruginibacter sp. SUN106 TaxID=2978348 RepID=UPI003D35F68C